jgi:exo-1,4-beta-D-glucosaminidase
MAHITIFADLHNYEDKPVDGVLSGSIDGVAFHRTVELQPDETKRVTFTPEEYRQLNLQHPRLWWPWQMGAQNLYRAEVRFTANGAVSDKTETSFGIREITSELTPEGYRLFKVNGRRILVRGAGWWSDMLLRTSKENQEAQMRYARAMNLNTIRMDGKFEDENFLVLADKYGMLLMPGWACCDHWEKWQDWTPENYLVAGESLRSVARRFANHPAVLAWLNGDDNPPPERVARMYIDVLEQEAWPDPVIASATGKLAAVTGETGVKMPGPYDYVPPSYWLRDKKLGGAFGFNTETSIGGAVPPLASLKEFIPEDHLWPLGEYWNFHAGGGKAFVNDLQATTDAMRATYGVATSAADYAMKSQVINYDGQRAMFEGYSRNKYHATGVLHEMLNQSWPSVIWQMYDTSLRPGGSFFGARLGCEPLHVQYSYDDRSIIVVNSLYKPFQKLKVTAKVYSFDLTEKFSKSAVIGVAADSSNRVFTLPEIKGLSTTYFVRLTLERAGHGVVSLNFYWLSTKPDEYQWDKSTWFYTPTTSTADMTMLSSLPKVKLTAKQQFTVVGKDGHTTVEIENKTSHLAFFVHLTLSDKDGREVLPVFWDDNYFELMPGEKRISIATYSATTLGGTKPVVSVDGWNVEQAQATIAAH